MSSRIVALGLLLLALAACKREPYSRSTTGFSSLDKKLFYDFRSEPTSRTPNVDPATARRVLTAILPSYLSDRRQCKPAAATGEPGQVVPRIRAAVDGSFTAAGLKQTAYLVDVGECGQHPSTRRLVIVNATAIVANVSIPFGDTILDASDLDGNGTQELLLEGGSSGQGHLTRNASLLGFDKDKLVTVEDFGQVYDDSCRTDFSSKSVTASVVYYLPPPAGQKPRFMVELYRAPCAKQGQAKAWSRVTGSDLQTGQVQ